MFVGGVHVCAPGLSFFQKAPLKSCRKKFEKFRTTFQKMQENCRRSHFYELFRANFRGDTRRGHLDNLSNNCSLNANSLYFFSIARSF